MTDERVLACGLAEQLPHRHAGVGALAKVALVVLELLFVERLLRLGGQQLRTRYALGERARQRRFAGAIGAGDEVQAYAGNIQIRHRRALWHQSEALAGASSQSTAAVRRASVRLFAHSDT